jgi:hypothetical protein
MNDTIGRTPHAPVSRPTQPGDRRRRRSRWPALFAVALAGVAAAGVVIAVALAPGRPGGPAQLTLRMRPAAPLTTAVCTGELTRYGFSRRGASQLCSVGTGRTWYRAVLTNRGSGAYPRCRAKGRDSDGKIVFSGPVVLTFGGIAGLYARGHRSMTFSWYLPAVSGPVTRYVATCSVNDHPPT